MSEALTPEQRARHDAARKRSAIDYLWHTWINKRQDERRAAGESHEHDLYEWKAALQEIGRLPHWLRQARTGTLPTIHQQCSHSEPEPIQGNRLVCALGEDVTRCPILVSLYAHWIGEIARTGPDGSQPYGHASMDDCDDVAAKVCTWHIFTETMRRPFAIDTSEGYVQDEGDRMYWRTVYEHLSMASGHPDDEEAEP